MEENKKNKLWLGISSTLVMGLSNIFYWKFLSTGVSEYENYFYKQSRTVISSIPDKLKIVLVFMYLLV